MYRPRSGSNIRPWTGKHLRSPREWLSIRAARGTSALVEPNPQILVPDGKSFLIVDEGESYRCCCFGPGDLWSSPGAKGRADNPEAGADRT